VRDGLEALEMHAADRADIIVSAWTTMPHAARFERVMDELHPTPRSYSSVPGLVTSTTTFGFVT